MPSDSMNGPGSDLAGAKIEYIRQTLQELRQVAFDEGADMLCYLIEMAYVEAKDVLEGQRSLSVHRKRDKSADMPM